ncbi:MAG: serine O-acetyltransferase [Alistipes senegalensis]|nr:serine O-acetyltransferase [Oxalobacter formigenes]MCM1280805.1 serine O-acetyltransferase [Alistipes senegalensis]
MFRHLRDDIASILERDPAARNAWEVLTCYPGLHAILLHRISHWLWQRRLRWLGRFLSSLSRLLTGIEIHPGAVIGRRVFIDHGFGVVIGETAEVGDDCTIYQGVTLGGTSLAEGKKRHPTLGSGVIVGAGAQLLGNFTVGENAKVGSNAVVVREIPAGATAVGNPARIILQTDRERENDAASRLFSSYGIAPKGDDPLYKALRGLINNAAAQEAQLKNLRQALENAGIECEDAPEEEKVDMKQLEQLERLVE